MDKPQEHRALVPIGKRGEWEASLPHRQPLTAAGRLAQDRHACSSASLLPPPLRPGLPLAAKSQHRVNKDIVCNHRKARTEGAAQSTRGRKGEEEEEGGTGVRKL